MSIQLGASYQDKITGFTGVATGYVKYITGCNQALLVPRAKDDGSLTGAEWFDEQRLVKFGDAVIVIENGSNPGCDKAAPKR
jgi:hypothetical protein